MSFFLPPLPVTEITYTPQHEERQSIAQTHNKVIEEIPSEANRLENGIAGSFPGFLAGYRLPWLIYIDRIRLGLQLHWTVEKATSWS